MSAFAADVRPRSLSTGARPIKIEAICKKNRIRANAVLRFAFAFLLKVSFERKAKRVFAQLFASKSWASREAAAKCTRSVLSRQGHCRKAEKIAAAGNTKRRHGRRECRSDVQKVASGKFLCVRAAFFLLFVKHKKQGKKNIPFGKFFHLHPLHRQFRHNIVVHKSPQEQPTQSVSVCAEGFHEP